MVKIDELLDIILKYGGSGYQKDFLLTWEKSLDEINQVLAVAEALKFLREGMVSTTCFDSGLAVSQFRDKSTRTRFSFASAANLLGLTVQDLDEEKTQISHGETVRETATMISFLTEIIGIRDDMFLGRGNRYMLEVAQALDEGFQSGVLAQRPGIVNLQCDLDHPTQSMSDLLHIKHYFGGIEELKGKKLAMTWAYSPSYGKPLSVPQGLIALMTRFGLDVTLAHPRGYDLVPEVVEIAGRQAVAGGGKFEVVDSMEEAFNNAHVVYPKSWAPYEIMKERTELLSRGDSAGLEKLEIHCLEKNAEYKNWHCNQDMMNLTDNGKALYMHCLPADISGVSCEAGEVSAPVFDKYRLDTYRQAGLKPYIIAAMIIVNRFADPHELVHKISKRGKSRLI